MEAQDKWYIEQFTAPAMMNRNMVRLGNWTFQRWKTGTGEIKSITYAEGWRIMKELSCGLMEMGFQKGDRGALMCHTCPEWGWADYSILCSGGITVCIYPSLSEAEMCYIINDSGSSILYLQDEITLAKVIKAWDKLPELKQVIVMKDEYHSSDSRVMSFGDLRGVWSFWQKIVMFLKRDGVRSSSQTT